jgi:hypothetical protein
VVEFAEVLGRRLSLDDTGQLVAGHRLHAIFAGRTVDAVETQLFPAAL